MNLHHAITIAVRAHAGQFDLDGVTPYILHPLRVMLAVKGDTDAMMVGVLHDVVEDCPAWPLERLRREGFSAAVLDGVDAVTHRKAAGESYFDYVRRATANPLGRKVKLADLTDNMSRVPDTVKGRMLGERYANAVKIIKATEEVP